VECRENRWEKPFGVLRTSGGFLCAALTGDIWPVYGGRIAAVYERGKM
jgi:hypothetical protein